MIFQFVLDLPKDLPPSLAHAAQACRERLAGERDIEVRTDFSPDEAQAGGTFTLELRLDHVAVEAALALSTTLPALCPIGEAFLLERIGEDRLRVVAASPRAAIYGLFRVEDHLLAGDLGNVVGRTLHVPHFRDRAGGILRFAQDPARDFNPHQYACWLARHGINVNGLHTGETNLTPEAAEAFEIDCMVGGSSNFFFNLFASVKSLQAQEEMAERWKREQPESMLTTQPRAHNHKVVPVLSVFTEFGRARHREFLDTLLMRHPRATRLLFTFGDWGSIHGDECPVVGHLPTHQRVIRWLVEIDQIAREIRPGVKVIARTWYYPADFIQAMIDETPPGIGIRQKEPATICLDEPVGWGLEQDNYSDIMVNTFELSKKYGPVYLSGGRKRGADFYAAVGMGDTDESIDPAIGIATPWLAARKLRRLAENGIVNFATWWGGLNFDAYSPNHEVIRAFIWDPFQDADACIERIARRDFGAGHAEAMVAFWHEVNEALEGWDFVNWKQQLETFVGRADRVYFKAINETSLRESAWCEQFWPNARLLLASQRRTVERLDIAVNDIRTIFATLADGPPRQRARQQLGWTWLLRNMLLSEYHVLSGIVLCDGETDCPGLTHRDFATIRDAELANTEDTIAALRWIERPNFKFLSWGEADLPANIAMLDEKLILLRKPA